MTKKLKRNYFAQPSVEVAKGLLGRKLVREFDNGSTIYGIIREVSAWEGNKKSMDDNISETPFGRLNVSTKFGKHLIDIVTNEKIDASCVTLIAGYFDWNGNGQLVQGPGNLSKALHVDSNFNGRLIDNSQLYIAGDQPENIEILKRKKSNLPWNCKGYFYTK